MCGCVYVCVWVWMDGCVCGWVVVGVWMGGEAVTTATNHHHYHRHIYGVSTFICVISHPMVRLGGVRLGGVRLVGVRLGGVRLGHMSYPFHPFVASFVPFDRLAYLPSFA